MAKHKAPQFIQVPQLAERRALRVEVGSWPRCSGAHVELYLRPAEEARDGIPCVYSWGHVGPGTPMPAWDNRHLYLGSVHVDVVPEDLESILEAHTDAILSLAARYLGSEWNGENHVGRWDLDEGAAEELLARALDECSRYWDADDWIAGDPRSVIDSAIDSGIQAAAAAEQECAASMGATLSSSDLVEAITARIESEIDDLSRGDRHMRAEDRLRRMQLSHTLRGGGAS